MVHAYYLREVWVVREQEHELAQLLNRIFERASNLLD